MEGEMPKDPMMLMSFINMKLRDFYPTLDALCDDMDVDRQEVLVTHKHNVIIESVPSLL